MRSLLPAGRSFPFAVVLASLLIFAASTRAQSDEVTNSETDPIKLFELGQDAHAKNDLKRAVALYDAALKLRPEFPEAEYQRGVALISLNRPAEAEQSLRRSIELRKDWPLPYTALAALLSRSNRDSEAEPLLRRALQLGAKDSATFAALASIRVQAGDRKEALDLARRATEDEDAPAAAWVLRGMIERDGGDKLAAAASLERALQVDPNNVAALKERAELRADSGDYEHAIGDLKAALALKPDDHAASTRLVGFYKLAGKPDEARRIAETPGPGDGVANSQGSGVLIVGTAAEIEAANSEDAAKARPALEKLVAQNSRNASLLARLGEVTRTTDPQESLECYRRASEIDPRNPEYLSGYAAALVQARRFAEAVELLRRVITTAPNNHAAHANLATALYELKRYTEALPELEWLVNANPTDTAITYYFIGSAHDHLEEYREALTAYEAFLASADAVKHKREIETVQLRLPKLRDQIKRGRGVKHKTQ